MPEYLSPGQFQLSSGDPEGGSSCVAYSFAAAINAATLGRDHPTGREVRDATGDHSGGLELSQCAAVAIRDYELSVTTGVFTRAIFEERMQSGMWIAVLIGGYHPVGLSPFTGQPGGIFNHGVCLQPVEKAMDPLADGRRPGIYRYHGAEYPQELIREFAANLRLSNGGLAGDDHFEASLMPAPMPLPVKPTVRVSTGSFRTYTVHNTGRLHAVGSSPRTLPVNSKIPVGAKEYPVYIGSNPTPMRQVMAGPFAGLWVVAHGVLPFSLY